MTDKVPDLTAWPLEAVKEFMRVRGYRYTVRETRAPYEADGASAKEWFVVRTAVKDDGVWELLVCGKTTKGGVKCGLQNK